MKRWMAILAAALAGCASGQVYHTLSGRPEVTIQGVPRQKVMETLVQMSKDNGENVMNITDDSFYTQVELGNHHIPKYAKRSYHFQESMNTVRVICSFEILTAVEGGGDFEREDITTHEGGPRCMDTLAQLQQKLK